MPVVECPECGELEQGCDDKDLVTNLSAHLKEKHGRDDAEAEAKDCVEQLAYEATDS